MRWSRFPAIESLPITAAAQEVQRSAYPGAYAQHEPTARAFASALTGQSPQSLDCTLRAPDAAGDPAAVQQRLTSAFGALDAGTEGRTLTVQAQGTRAWAVAQWAVANAKSLSITAVAVDGQTWTRSGHDGWQPGDAPAGQVSITVAAEPAK